MPKQPDFEAPTLDALIREIERTNARLEVLDVPAMSGLYGVYLEADFFIPDGLLETSSLVYVGKAENLKKRLIPTACISDS
jgi:excinuclease UvrABC nuclease subunit